MEIQRLDSVGAVAPAAVASAVGEQAALPATLPTLQAQVPPAPAAVHDEVVRTAQPAAGGINSVGQAYYTQYQIDLKTRIVRVQLVDQTSGQVVQQIPSEALARFAASWDAYIGRLLDHQT